MPQRNKKRVKNAYHCIPYKPSKRNLILKKNRKLRSKTIGKKKTKRKFLKINFFHNAGKFKKKGFWFNESDVFLGTLTDQDYKYVRCNAPCLKCCKCEFISSRMKCLHKHSTKHYELDTPTRTLELKKPILKCSYCPHVYTKLTDLLKHVEYVHLEKKDYKKNKIDTLEKRLKDIYVDIKKLKLEISALNLCNESDKTDTLLENGNIDERKSNVSEYNSSESSDMSPNFKTDGFKSSSKVLKRSYSSVCNSIPSEVQLIPDDNNENFHTKTKFVSATTSPKKSLDQQLKLDIRVEKTQQNKTTFNTNTNCQQKNSRSKNSHTACNICSTKFPNIEELEEHKQSDAHDKMTFLCPTCSTVFSNLKDLKLHRGKTKHKKIKLLCSVCLTHFPSKFQLDFHTKTTKHKLVNKFPKGSALCLTCNSIFSSKSNLDQHILNNHIGSASSISSLCNSTNETKNTLDQQKANSKHEIKNNLCTICLKGFNSKAQLKKHMKKGVHEVVESSIRRMVTKTCLQPSMITEQKPESQFINLRQLLRNTEQKNITCTLCLRQFATEENLTEHMENDSHNSLLVSVNDITLAGQTPKIDIQQYINNKQKHKTLFSTHEVAVDDNLQKDPITNAWRIPRSIFSVNESTKVSEYSESATEPRKVICTLCNKEFAAKESLKQHMANAHISHSASVHQVTSINNSPHYDTALGGQKPVNFGSASEFNDVKLQLKTAANKRIVCTICQKEFATEIDLEQHINSNVIKHKNTSSIIYEVGADKKLQEQSITNARQEARNIFSVNESTKVSEYSDSATKPRKIICTLCNREFAAEVSLKQHMANAHISHPASVHQVTSINNSPYHDVKPQMEIVANKRIVCTICQKEFATEIDLEQHINSNVMKHKNASSIIHEVGADKKLQEQSITNARQEARKIFSVNESSKISKCSESTTKPRKIICTLCNREFAAEVSLKQHMANAHISHPASVHLVTSINNSPYHDVKPQMEIVANKRIVCTICQKEFATEIDLEQHINSNVMKHKNASSIIHEVGADKKLQEQSITNARQEARNIFSVNESTKVSEYSDSATKPRKIICTLCNREFAAEVSLKQHMANAHISHPASVHQVTSINNSPYHDVKPQMEIVANKRIVCTICQKEFATEIDLEQHINSNVMKHKNASSIIHEVGADKKLQEQSITNARQEARNIFSVNESTKVSEYSDSATKPRKIICTLCNREFAAEVSLKQHMANAHISHPASVHQVTSINNSPYHDVKPQMEIVANKRIVCTICQKEFATEIDLEQHINSNVMKHKNASSIIHEVGADKKLQEQSITNAKQEARKIFSVNESSKISKCSESTTKPRKIICTLCNREFAAEVSLKQHMANAHISHPASVHLVTSINNSPYHDVKPQMEIVANKRIVCTICQKEFATEIDLEQHINSNVMKHKNASSIIHEVGADKKLQEQSITNARQEARNIFSVNESTKVSEYSDSATKPRKIICTLCNREFAAEVSLKQHMANAHISHPASVHQVTSINNSPYHDVKPQMEIVANKRIVCTICQKEFATEIDLEQHINSNVMKHKNASSIIHEVGADKKLQEQSISNAKQEARNIFSVNESSKISKCSESATKPRKIICTLCNREFAAEVSLKEHMANAHISHPASVHQVTSINNSPYHDVKPQMDTAANKRIVCTICQKEFATEIDLEQHMNSNVIKHKTASSAIHEVAAHKNLQEQAMDNAVQELKNIFSPCEFMDVGQDSGSNKPKNLTCTVCCKQFTAEESLKQHMENAHKSDSATVQKITSNENSLDHNTTLDEQKPANFGSASEFNDVKSQLNTAANQRIICTICQKEFRAKQDLEQHMNSNVIKHKNASSAIHGVAADKSLQEQPIDNAVQELENIFSPSEFTDVGQDSGSNKPKTITCTVCCKQFTAEVSLKQHMENAHKSDSASVQQITSNKNSLHHDTTLDEQKPVNFGSVSEKIVCTICHREFRAKQDLEQHMNSNVIKHKNASSAIHGVAADKSLQELPIDNAVQELENIFSPSEFTDVGQDSGSNRPKTITCTVCCKQFTAEVSLKQHMENAHKSDSASVQQITSNKNSLHHDTTLDEQKPVNFGSVSEKIVCTICHREFRAKQDLEQHMNSNVIKHKTASVRLPEQRKITCTLCKKQFSDEACLKQHMRSSAHKTVPSSTFGFPIDKYHNNQEQENISPLCEVKSKSTNILNQDSGSSGNKKYKCTICQKQFVAAKDLQQHIESNVHETKSICCTTCGSKFSTLESLENHLRSTKHQIIECSICRRNFVSKNALDEHLKNSKVHKEITALNPALVETANGHSSLSYICKLCNYSFESKNILDQHMADGHYLVFTCNMCLKEFASTQDVVQHIQAVHEIGGYFCPICDKMFNYEFSLNDHMKSTGHAYLDSVCTICFATFSSENALKQHLENTSHKYVNRY